MRRNRLQWLPRPSAPEREAPTLAAGAGSADVAALAGPPPTWPGDPTLSWRDEFVFLLHTASEIEHALMVQYLYAAWSLPVGHAWAAPITLVAKQEMGHLVTVQNILRSLNAPLSLDREDYPFRSELYPFEFTLERLSLSSLAKYVLAEMPAEPGLSAAETDELRRAAGLGGAAVVNRVGDLYDRLSFLVETHLSDADFSPSSVPRQASPQGWRSDDDNDVLVATVANQREALAALEKIAEQGEGNQHPGAGAPPSHFEVLLGIYRELKQAGTDPSLPVPRNPNTSPPPAEAAADELAGGRISHQRARLWALLGNVRYRMLLVDVQHALWLETDLDGPENEVRQHAFEQMFHLGALSRVLTALPQAEGASSRAAMPFEMPYSMDFPDQEIGRWLLHRDLLDAAAGLLREIEAQGEPTAAERALLDRLRARDAAHRSSVDQHVAALRPPGEGQVPTVRDLRLLPPMVIGRFGSSPEPLENYELGEPGQDGWAPLRPLETLVVDPASGEVSGVSTPASVRFRDASGRVKPVCPFLEVWAQLADGGPLVPLTALHLQRLGLSPASLRWRVRAANRKAERRTGDAGDRIGADTGFFSGHEPQPLRGVAANFKPGRSISFGAVRYLRPNALFPELRLRFTPPRGQVFGPSAADPNVAADVYDAARGRWDGHQDGADDTPPPTAPGGIFAQDGEGRSLGYLDDACDAIVSVELALPGGQVFTAAARIAAGPPHYSPDTLPVRTVADELEQILLGPEVAIPLSPARADELGLRAAEIVRRGLGTIRLMNTEAMNRGGMAAHDRFWGRAAEPLFPLDRAGRVNVEAAHAGVVRALAGLTSAPGTPARSAAVGALQDMAQRLRRYDQVGELGNAGRRRMPAMMRGADGLHLGLTRRQVATVERAAEALAGAPPAATPEARMLVLVQNFSAAASTRHGSISVGGGQSLNDLFRGDPVTVLAFLRRGVVQGAQAPANLIGQPLIRPGDPDASALVFLVSDEGLGHPMRSRFAQTWPNLEGRSGREVLREWIASLPPA